MGSIRKNSLFGMYFAFLCFIPDKKTYYIALSEVFLRISYISNPIDTDIVKTMTKIIEMVTPRRAKNVRKDFTIADQVATYSYIHLIQTK